MMKKFLALAVGAALSLDASAGYIRYDLRGPIEGATVEGAIYQHDDDHSLAYYDFVVRIAGEVAHEEPCPNPWNDGPFPSTHSLVCYPQFVPYTAFDIHASTPTTSFAHGGPANMLFDALLGPRMQVQLKIDFQPQAGGGFSYHADYSAWFPLTGDFFSGSGDMDGVATESAVDPEFAELLDSWGGHAEGVESTPPVYIGNETPLPGDVPEPGSIALLMLGAAGMAGAARVSRAARRR